MARHRREGARQALNQRVLRGLQFLVGHRTLAEDPPQLLHELDERGISLVADDVAAGAERPWSLAIREARVYAVAVALLFADVCVQARLEHAAEHGVHHLQRVVVGRRARRTWLTNIHRRLRGARAIDEKDGRLLWRRHGRIRERRPASRLWPRSQRLLDDGLHARQP